MNTASRVSTTPLWLCLLTLLVGVGVLGYYLFQSHQSLVRQQAEIADLHRDLYELSSKFGRSQQDNNTHFEALRVALKEVVDIEFDKNGALITKKRQRKNGVELR